MNSLAEEIQASVLAIVDEISKMSTNKSVKSLTTSIRGIEFKIISFQGVYDVNEITSDDEEVELIPSFVVFKKTQSGINAQNSIGLVSEAIYARCRGFYFCSKCGKLVNEFHCVFNDSILPMTVACEDCNKNK